LLRHIEIGSNMKPTGVSGSDRTKPTTSKTSNKSAKNNAGAYDGKTVSGTKPEKITPPPQQAMTSGGSQQHKSVKRAQVESLTPPTIAPQTETPQSNVAATATPLLASQDTALDPSARSVMMGTLPEASNRPPEPQGGPPIPVTSQANLTPGPTPRSFSELEDAILEVKGGTIKDLKEFAVTGLRAPHAFYRVSANAMLNFLKAVDKNLDQETFISMDLNKVVEDYVGAFAECRTSLLGNGGTLKQIREFTRLCKTFGLGFEATALDGLVAAYVPSPEDTYVSKEEVKNYINLFLIFSDMRPYEKFAVDPDKTWIELQQWQATWGSVQGNGLSRLANFTKLKNEVLPNLGRANERKLHQLRKVAARVESETGSLEATFAREKVDHRLDGLESKKTMAAEQRRLQKDRENTKKQKELSEPLNAEEQQKKEQNNAPLTMQSAQDEKQLDEKQLDDEKAPELATPTPDIQKKELKTESDRPRWYLPPSNPPRTTTVFQPAEVGGFTLTEKSEGHILETHRAGNKHIPMKSQFPSLRNRDILKGIKSVANSPEGQWRTSATDDEVIIKLGKMDVGRRATNQWDGTIAVVAHAETQEIITAYPLNLSQAKSASEAE
jgi:hypothetical protein